MLQLVKQLVTDVESFFFKVDFRLEKVWSNIKIAWNFRSYIDEIFKNSRNYKFDH